MRPILVASLAASALLVVACDAGGKAADTSAKGPALAIASPRMDQVLDYPAPKEGEAAPKRRVEVMFDLRDYEIGKVDDGKNGQHLHLIVDNEPYQAIYDVTKAIPLDLAEGTHVIRAFPSAGPKDAKGALEHESRKNPGAFAWVRFHVRTKSDDPALTGFDPVGKPTLTYSRPKGDYKVGAATHSKFLLDFYVTGTTLSATGPRVRAALDGKAVVGADGKPLGELLEWKPYVLESPAVGDHELVIELFDRSGRPIDGPFNRTARKFRVLEK